MTIIFVDAMYIYVVLSLEFSESNHKALTKNLFVVPQ